MKSKGSLSFAWFAAVFVTLFVILFGAVVRISGSGAGCGQHWPSCHGEVVHLPQSIETWIEMTHRLTSGLSMLVVFALTVWTFRAMPAGHAARKAAAWSSFFMVTEALVGAGLVLLALVGENDSMPRAFVMALHLVNTSALLFAMVVAAWAVGSPQHLVLGLFSLGGPGRGRNSDRWRRHSHWVGALLIVIVSAAGAVTALGDTLYPVGERSSLDVARSMTSSGGHFLEHLRGIHPILATLAVSFWISAAARYPKPWGMWIIGLSLIQVAAGVLNVFLSAPGWMQVLHLALANALFLAWTCAWLDQARSPAHRPATTSPPPSVMV